MTFLVWYKYQQWNLIDYNKVNTNKIKATSLDMSGLQHLRIWLSYGICVGLIQLCVFRVVWNWGSATSNRWSTREIFSWASRQLHVLYYPVACMLAFYKGFLNIAYAGIQNCYGMPWQSCRSDRSCLFDLTPLIRKHQGCQYCKAQFHGLMYENLTRITCMHHHSTENMRTKKKQTTRNAAVQMITT